MYDVDTTVCTSCIDNCFMCTSLINCGACNDGYFVQQRLTKTVCVDTCDDSFSMIDGVCYKQYNSGATNPTDDPLYIEAMISSTLDTVTFTFNSFNPIVEFILIGRLPVDTEGRMPEGHQCGSMTDSSAQIPYLEYKPSYDLDGITVTGTEVTLTLSQLVMCGFWQDRNNMDGVLHGYAVSTYRDDSFLSFARNIAIMYLYQVDPLGLNINEAQIVGTMVNADNYYSGQMLSIDALSSLSTSFYRVGYENEDGASPDTAINARRGDALYLAVQLPVDLISTYHIWLPDTVQMTNLANPANLPIDLTVSLYNNDV